MKNKNAQARYNLINHRLRNNMRPCPSLQELVDYVNDRLAAEVSVSTIQKDIYAMRHDENLGYFAPIMYDPYQNGYFYTDKEFTISIQELLDKIELLKTKLSRTATGLKL